MAEHKNPTASEVAERANRKIGALAEELSEVYGLLLTELDRDNKLLTGIERRNKKIQELERDLKSREAQTARLKARIESLEATKAIRLQKKYWAVRKSLSRRSDA